MSKKRTGRAGNDPGRRVRSILLWTLFGVLFVAAAITALSLLLHRPAGKTESSAPAVTALPEPTAAPTPELTEAPAVPEATEPAVSEEPEAAEALQSSEEAAPAEEAEETEPPAAALTEHIIAQRALNKRDGFPVLRWDAEHFELDERGRMTWTGEGARTLTGIDVSEHQFDINWAEVAADGIDFAIIRMGRRGSTKGGLFEDEYFRQNMTGAALNGVPVGVYFFSQATNEAEALEEVEYLLKALEGYDIAFPVVFDWEIVGAEDDRTFNVERNTLCQCAKIFCNKVAEAGYQPMIYFTRYLGYRKYMLRDLTDYGFWFAEYSKFPSTIIDFTMWQYSDTGTVAGINGAVDMNIYFIPE